MKQNAHSKAVMHSIVKRKPLRFDPRKSGNPDFWYFEPPDSAELLKSLSPQRMDGQPIFLGGTLAVHEEEESDNSLALALESARAKSPYGKSEQADWWVRAGCPWPDAQGTMEAAGDPR